MTAALTASCANARPVPRKTWSELPNVPCAVNLPKVRALLLLLVLAASERAQWLDRDHHLPVHSPPHSMRDVTGPEAVLVGVWIETLLYGERLQISLPNPPLTHPHRSLCPPLRHLSLVRRLGQSQGPSRRLETRRHRHCHVHPLHAARRPRPSSFNHRTRSPNFPRAPRAHTPSICPQRFIVISDPKRPSQGFIDIPRLAHVY